MPIEWRTGGDPSRLQLELSAVRIIYEVPAHLDEMRPPGRTLLLHKVHRLLFLSIVRVFSFFFLSNIHLLNLIKKKKISFQSLYFPSSFISPSLFFVLFFQILILMCYFFEKNFFSVLFFKK